ncbi:MAG: hypothetical protein A3K10_11520 [Bacteroidetes bacterium RIFCSPLOWO2_12_FULL_31_6]|nr:MAG: hypothetical protein A3K10_11520 [Bacteroidetes bacterium RIFCSPLOWO2_12_FULL_31_6]
MKALFTNTRTYFILSLSAMAIGLSLSKPLIALGLFGLLIVWIVDGNISLKLKAFYNNKIALIISSIYLLTLIGLVYTSNFDFAIDDVRRKIPLFFLPFFFSGFNPLTKKELSLVLKIYIAGVVAATIWSLFVYLGGLPIAIIDDRELSRFNSHIRFGLEIALALFFALYFIWNNSSIIVRIIWCCVALWLFFSLFLFNLFTGIVVVFVTSSILFLVFGWIAKRKYLKLILISTFILLFVGFFLFVKSAITDYYSCNTIEQLKEIPFTEDGNPYVRDAKAINSTYKENGYFVDKNISLNEFSAAWNTRSKIDFNGRDLKNQELKNTLIRFVTSKGQRKDKKAIERLTSEEVKAIENGISNYKYLTMNSFSVRLHQIIWEYDSNKNGRNINGHSVFMRWEYCKTAIHILKNNLLLGVGTGDVQDAFNLQYVKDDSALAPHYRLRAHNQYLTYGVTFGILGLIWFLSFLFYPIIKTKLYKNYLYLTFFSIIILSMITEDTLETQVGINFFVFFNTILLLSINTTNDVNN